MITCSFCGTLNQVGAAFCNSCGGALSVAAASQAQAAQAAARTTAQATYTAQAAQATAQQPHPQFATGRLPPQSRLGKRYLVLKTIGKGGMAAVYLATDTKSRRPVAIKEMSQDGLSASELKESLISFNAEADMLTRLSHPNLPKVYERFSEGSRHYLVMEYIEGETLEQKQAAV
ncbi:MAG: inactive serine/threonine-protein kinase VRK3, partial [Ktedonobacterales bacterium]